MRNQHLDDAAAKSQARNPLLAAAVTAALFAAASPQVHAVSFQVPGTSTTVDVGGYAKLDIIYNSISAGDNNQANIEYVPGGVPLDPQDATEEDQILFNGRESRVWLKTSTPTDEGDLKTHLEFDFDTNEGNQVVSNSHGARVRHAYGTYKNLLLGRTWSTFMYLPGLPETNDFGGPTGDIFVRQAQVRLTWPMEGGHSWQLAFENPETFVNDFQGFGGGGGARTSVDDDQIPDIVLRYNAPTWSVAALVRSLNVENVAVDDGDTGIALQFGWAMPFGNGHKFQGMLSAGEGIGRYMSLAAHTDAIVTAGGELEALQMVGGFAGVQFKTGGTGRVNLVYGFSSADDPVGLAGSGLTEKTQSIHANYMWNATKNLRHGIEVIFATREVYNGADGDLTRVQWSSKFDF